MVRFLNLRILAGEFDRPSIRTSDPTGADNNPLCWPRGYGGEAQGRKTLAYELEARDLRDRALATIR